MHREGGSRTPQRADHVGCSTAWRRPARPRVTARGVGRARAPTGRAHAQGGAPPLPRGEGVYGEAAAAAAQADAEAVAMAPFPDEVDVFTAPHWRMKQLVGRYCDKVTERGAEGGAEERTGSGRPGLRASRNPPALAPCEPRGSRTFPPGLWDVPSGRASPPLRPARGSGLRGSNGRSRPPGAAAAVPTGFRGPGSAGGGSRVASAGRFCGCSPPQSCPPGSFGLFGSLCKHCPPPGPVTCLLPGSRGSGSQPQARACFPCQRRTGLVP